MYEVRLLAGRQTYAFMVSRTALRLCTENILNDNRVLKQQKMQRRTFAGCLMSAARIVQCDVQLLFSINVAAMAAMAAASTEVLYNSEIPIRLLKLFTTFCYDIFHLVGTRTQRVWVRVRTLNFQMGTIAMNTDALHPVQCWENDDGGRILEDNQSQIKLRTFIVGDSWTSFVFGGSLQVVGTHHMWTHIIFIIITRPKAIILAH